MTAFASGAPAANRRLVLREVAGIEVRTSNPRETRLAFWINTYNALIAHGIIALGLHRTMWDVPDFFDRICCRVGSHLVSAGEVEHGILRGNRPHPLAITPPFGAEDPRRARSITPLDPRIHCAINCGARSCPPVRVYVPDQVDAQLDAAARAFVNREVALGADRLTVTELFRWFAGDFAERPDGVAGFLVRYLPEGPIRAALRTQGLGGVTWRPLRLAACAIAR